MTLKKFYPIALTLSLFFASIDSQSTRGAQVLDTPSGTNVAATLSLIIVSLLNDGETFKIEAKSNDTIQSIESILEKKIDFEEMFQCLEFKQKPLKDKEKTLLNYGIKNNMTLYVREISKPFSFSDFKESENLEQAFDGDEWRPAGAGMSYFGICQNVNCKAYMKEVVILRGFGKFDIGKDRGKKKGTCICPCCYKFVPDVKECGFSCCKYKIEGERQVVNQNGMTKLEYYEEEDIHNQQGSTIKFSSKGGALTTYEWLTIEVTGLYD